jgi:hypothetical protein
MKKINLYCPINTTGYGLASLNILKNLYKNDIDLTLSHIGGIDIENKEDVPIIEDLLNKQDVLDPHSPCLKIWHQFDLASRIGCGKYYAYPFFEIDTFNKREKNHLNIPDELIVSSEWAKQVLLSNNVNKPIHIVPLGVDTDIFNNSDKKISKYDKYVFITIGKWEIRKSHDLVIELFNRAFELGDNVELWMITHNPFLSDKELQVWYDMVNKSKLKDKIKIFPRVQNQKALAEIISYSNCGIYISRAEGWNLDLLETMAMDKPVIVTNYSAHTEFCNADNSYLVDIDTLEPAKDNKWFDGTGNWAAIQDHQKNTIIDYMRYMYTNNITSNEAGINTAKKFSWTNSAQKILGCIFQ